MNALDFPVELPLWYLAASAVAMFLLGLWSRHVWETDVDGDDADPTEGYWRRQYHDLLHQRDVDRNRHAARADYRRRHRPPRRPYSPAAGCVTDAPAWTYAELDEPVEDLRYVDDRQLEAVG